MNAYNELYLDDAMANLGDMVEYAVCTLGYAPDDFFGWFISSGIASKFENGNPKYVAGMSGVELADAVLAAVNMQSERHHQPHLSSKGREYWAGWTLAYYYVYGIILHGRIQYFFNAGIQPVYLVYEQHVAGGEICKYGRKVACMGYCWA